MLSRLAHISKPLALLATTGLIWISVHGLFMHPDSHVKAGEAHVCTLCEIHQFSYTFPETFRFVAETLPPVALHTYRETRVSLKPVHRLGLRGPPFFATS